MLRPKRGPTLPEHSFHLRDTDQHTLGSSADRRRARTFSFLTWSRPRIRSSLRRIPTIIKLILVVHILIMIYYAAIWQIHIEIQFYKRTWVKQEILKLEPLAGCFTPERLAVDGNVYNVSQRLYGPKHTELHAGLEMRLGMDCYDYAGTIPYPPAKPSTKQQDQLPREQRTNYHTYWRADLEPFSDRQEWMLKSFFATQDLSRSTLILWTNDIKLADHLRIAIYLRAYPPAFEVRAADIVDLARGTALEGSPRLIGTTDSKAWVDGDLVRLLVIWKLGGVWVDMDSLLTRDLAPLLDHEFVTQWDCYDKIYQPMNGALMHFHKHSPYLCEAFHIMASPSNPPPHPGSTDWGSHLYYKLWRRLIATSIPPFKVLPFCFSDGRSCRLDNRLPDPFTPDSRTWGSGRRLGEGQELDEVLRKVFAVHLHNQWEKAFPKGGWVERLLLRKYNLLPIVQRQQAFGA